MMKKFEREGGEFQGELIANPHAWSTCPTARCVCVVRRVWGGLWVEVASVEDERIER